MIWIIAVILAILWLVGITTAYTFGGYIHVLLVLAILVAGYGLYQSSDMGGKKLSR